MKTTNHHPTPAHSPAEILLTARLARAKLEAQLLEELLAALRSENDRAAQTPLMGPRPAAPSLGKKSSVISHQSPVEKAPRKPRASVAPEGSAAQRLAAAIASMESNFTSMDLRNKVRADGGG